MVKAETKKIRTKDAKAKKFELVVDILPEVQVNKKDQNLVLSKDAQSIQRTFSHPRVDFSLEKQDQKQIVKFFTSSTRRQDRAVVGTWAAHAKNMIVGLTKGYEYKMKIVYTHFPITVKVVGSEVQITNFLGEKNPRTAAIVGDTKVQAEKEVVKVSGPDKEAVGQTCVNIERACVLSKMDRRRFSDGIYLFERGVKE